MMSSFEVGPEREQLEVPEGLDKETVTWFLEKFGYLATEIGLEDLQAHPNPEATREEVQNFQELSKQRPSTPEGNAGAIYILRRTIELGREAFDKSW